MEILIAMAVGFLLGAYIRKPFALLRKSETPVEQIPQPQMEEQSEKTDRMPYWEQHDNIMRYDGTEQK